MPSRRSWELHEGEVLDTIRGFDVLRCERCGFSHVIPIPTTDELVHAYKEDYYSVEKPLYLARYEEDLEWWNLVYAERYDFLEALLPTSRRRLVDIGSGPGHFLKLGLSRGWEVLGIEPSRQAAEYSSGRGVPVTQVFLTAANVDEFGTFNAVNMHEVLEHIPDPQEMLGLAGRLLGPGGVLSVIVPNDYNVLQVLLRAELGFSPWWVAPPHHINYFDPSSLAELVGRKGFTVLHQSTTFPLELFLLMGDNYVGSNPVGRTIHSKRKRMELNLSRAGANGLKLQIYSKLAELGIGRELILYARKT